MTMKENVRLVNEVLGRNDLNEADVTVIADDWKAFCNDPEKYRDTAVVDMVNLYIDETIGELVDDISSNMPCDTYGMCACSSSCPQYFSCQA